MAINKDGDAKATLLFLQQGAQCSVIGFVEAFNALKRLSDRHFAGVNLLLIADDARYGAQPARDAH